VISALRGTVIESRDRESALEVVVEVGGVGYQVLVPTRDAEAFSRKSAKVFLHTYLHVREDALVLYGFSTIEDRDAFEVLMTTPGVGPKVALSALSVYSAAELQLAVSGEDAGALAAVPGIGPKLARRIVVELRDRLGVGPVSVESPGSAMSEARAALGELGYTPAEIAEALRGASHDASAEEIVAAALKVLGEKRRAV
jgi:Holliday junction DNA helicase RuvA